MTDWAIEYVKHVLQEKDWSAKRLAEESDLAVTTISRPLKPGGVDYSLSRATINKIYRATGIDPAPFVPNEIEEPAAIYSSGRPETEIDRALRNLDNAEAALPDGHGRNQIKIAVVGDMAQIVATVDIDGLAKLRRKLDHIEAMLTDK